jgi:hypothetical protein
MKGDADAGIDADAVRAREYTKRACDAGEQQACEMSKLLSIVDKGDVTVSFVNGMFQKECDAGHLQACVGLAENLLVGQGVDVDRAKAIALLKKACDGKIERACERLKSLK